MDTIRQHKWALWSGFLGATASCFVKMGVGDSSPLLNFVQTYICEQHLVKAWLADLDEVLLRGIHRVLGNLMIKYRINLMPCWRFIRTRILEEFAVRFYLFEVDYCQLFVVLPVRIICVVAMLVTNAYMIGSFLRGIQESGSVGGTSLSTAANFASSAIYGKLLWGEQMNGRWCLGFSCVLVGVLIITSETTTVSEDGARTSQRHDSNDNNDKPPRAHSAYPDIRTKISKLNNKVLQSRSPKPATPPPPPHGSNDKTPHANSACPDIRTKISKLNNKVHQSRSPKPTTPPPPLEIHTKTRNGSVHSKSGNITGKVASLRTSFMNGNNCSQQLENTPKARICKRSTPLITPSPERHCVRIPLKPVNTQSTSPSKRTKKKLRPESALEQYYDFEIKSSMSLPKLTNRSFVNECALCDSPLFERSTGHCKDAVADLSVRSCFHLFHSSCLKQTSNCFRSACPICEKPLAMWTACKEAAEFPGFWLQPVENFLRAMKGAPKDNVLGKDKCLPASTIRRYFRESNNLTEAQKLYIQDDPTGMNKGLQAALEWGGYIDYNTVPKGNVGFLKALRTRGIWKYDSKKDDLWLWEWGSIHPRQRCDQCQLIKRPLPIECHVTRGSSEAAFYCSELCSKRDRQRHKQTCDAWKLHGPKQ